VLIPRPETEQIITTALGIVDAEHMASVSIMDIGSGSGCIPITLKLELDNDQIVSDVSGCDVSIPALETARNNALKLKANVSFFESNLLEAVEILPDIITANLPYVDIKWDWTSPELKYEPALALYAEDGGLKLIKKLIDQIQEKKRDYRTRFLILEADTSQLNDIIKYASDKGFELISKDIFVLAFKY
jgi:release factor glutamine methyltransferase